MFNNGDKIHVHIKLNTAPKPTTKGDRSISNRLSNNITYVLKVQRLECLGKIC